MEKPVISIIIPCFNSEKTIVKTIESVSNQKGIINNDYEILVINDGSTDSTLKVLNRLKNKLNGINLRVMSLTKNSGVSFARNYGIKYANGKWVQFLDSDDLLNLNALKEIIRDSKQLGDCDLITYSYYTRDSKKRDYSSNRFSNHFFYKLELLKLFLSKKINFHISALVIKREFLLNKNIQFEPNKKVAEDLQFLIQCLYYIQKSYYKNFHIFTYQVFNSTAMAGYQVFTTEMSRSIAELYKFFSKINNEEIKEYLNFYLVNFYVYNLRNLLKSKSYSLDSIQILIKYFFVLKIKIKNFNNKRFCFLRAIQLMPVLCLLHLYIWRKNFVK